MLNRLLLYVNGMKLHLFFKKIASILSIGTHKHLRNVSIVYRNMEEPKNTIQLFHITMNKGEYDKIHTTQIGYNTHCLHFTVYMA